ncbi:MAG: S8/S53 family peptidase [Oscillibacter sp.]|nr:S8/S53 family peptidase [Oscillibacter sp.]
MKKHLSRLCILLTAILSLQLTAFAAAPTPASSNWATKALGFDSFRQQHSASLQYTPTIVVIDTGFDHTAILKDYPDIKLIETKDFFDGDSDVSPTSAGEWHGTSVLSILAGGLSACGVPANLVLYRVRVKDQQGPTTSEALEQAIQRAAQAYPGCLINLSLGGPLPDCAQDTLCPTIFQAISAGTVVIAAAGNERADLRLRRICCGHSGWFTDGLVAVSACDEGGYLCDDFSNYNGDIMIYGTNLVGAARTSNGKPVYISTLEGTSFAASLCTAAASAVLALNGPMSPKDLENTLKQCVTTTFSLENLPSAPSGNTPGNDTPIDNTPTCPGGICEPGSPNASQVQIDSVDVDQLDGHTVKFTMTATYSNIDEADLIPGIFTSGSAPDILSSDLSIQSGRMAFSITLSKSETFDYYLYIRLVESGKTIETELSHFAF